MNASPNCSLTVASEEEREPGGERIGELQQLPRGAAVLRPAP